jgi:hypothetical protein
LLWESKNAKHWNNAWVAKLRSDQQAERADVAIIVTPALPDGVNRMAFKDGVWICDFASATTLATALRHSLVEIAQARVLDPQRAAVRAGGRHGRRLHLGRERRLPGCG